MNEKRLIIKKEGIFNKIINFFKIKLFKKNNTILNQDEIKPSVQAVHNNSNNESLLKLYSIQKDLENKGINEDNLRALIKDLSLEEKEKLKKLYIDQNESIKNEMKVYKKKILTIKS